MLQLYDFATQLYTLLRFLAQSISFGSRVETSSFLQCDHRLPYGGEGNYIARPDPHPSLSYRAAR